MLKNSDHLFSQARGLLGSSLVSSGLGRGQLALSPCPLSFRSQPGLFLLVDGSVQRNLQECPRAQVLGPRVASLPPSLPSVYRASHSAKLKVTGELSCLSVGRPLTELEPTVQSYRYHPCYPHFIDEENRGQGRKVASLGSHNAASWDSRTQQVPEAPVTPFLCTVCSVRGAQIPRQGSSSGPRWP